MAKIKEWLDQRAVEKRRLYQLYGKPLEKDHTGEYAAISIEGQIILGVRAGEVLKKAVDTFGSGNFTLVRVGHATFGKWLSLGR